MRRHKANNTMIKRIYREACNEKIGWNTEVNSVNAQDWLKWSSQLRNMIVPRMYVSRFLQMPEHSMLGGDHCCSGMLNRFCERCATLADCRLQTTDYI